MVRFGHAHSPALLPLLFLVVLPCWWMFICVVISRWGGWTTLAEHYRTDKVFEGKWLRYQSADTSRKCGYRGALHVGVGREGLYLAVLLLFRIGHPTLFIPWEELTIAPVKRYWFLDCFEIKFRRTPHLSLFIRPNLREKLTRHLD